MGIGQKFKDFISTVESEEELELTDEEVKSLSQYEKHHVEGASKSVANASIVIFEPHDFTEAEDIGRHLKMRRACVLNLQRLDGTYRQRMTDFLSGVIFGLEGQIKKIGDNVILCSPKTLSVSADISNDLDNE